MLLSLIGAIFWPVLTGKQTKWSAVRGSLIGLVCAFIAGFVVPTGMSTSERTLMTPVRMQWQDSQKITDCNCYMTDQEGRLSNVLLTTHDTSIIVSDKLQENEVKVYRCSGYMKDGWAKMLIIPHVFHSYEVEISPTMLKTFAAPASTPVTYVNDKAFSVTQVAMTSGK